MSELQQHQPECRVVPDGYGVCHCKPTPTLGPQWWDLATAKLEAELATAQGNYAIQKAAADEADLRRSETVAMCEQLQAELAERDGYKTDYERCEEIIADLERQLAERDAAVKVGRENAEQYADAEANLWARIAQLETEADTVAWKISPAMAQVTIERLQAALVEQQDRIAELEGDFMIVTEQRLKLKAELDAKEGKPLTQDPIGDLLTERGKEYGPFVDHAEITQILKRAIAAHAQRRGVVLAPDQQEALDMACHKIGRIINGNPNHIDSWDDIAGYARLVADRLRGVVR